MPNHGKGGRKPERGEKKASPVVLKTTQTIRDGLEASASKAGRSLTKEVERRVLLGLPLGEPTDATASLLALIAKDIAKCEEVTGKRWDKDVKTWAMVRAALGKGAIESLVPETDRVITDVDGDAREAWNQIQSLRRDIESNNAMLSALGINTGMEQIPEFDVPVFDYASLVEQIEASEALAAGSARALTRKIAKTICELSEELTLVQNRYDGFARSTRDAIEQGEALWIEQLATDGRLFSYEWRPTNLIFPENSTRRSGMFGSGRGVGLAAIAERYR